MIRRLLTVVTLVGALAAPMSAADAATPTLGLSFTPARVTQNTTLHLKVSSAHLPRGTVLYLQRQYGTGHIYKNVKKLAVRNGATTAPGVSRGRYVYRIHAVRNGKTVLNTKARQLWSYGPVGLGRFCNSADVGGYCYFEQGTVPVGSSVLAFQVTGSGYNSGIDGSPAISVRGAKCRSLVVHWGIANYDTQNATMSGIGLTQTSADAQTATTAVGTIGSATFRISSGSWNLIPWSNDTENGPVIYIGGTLSCWTSNGG